MGHRRTRPSGLRGPMATHVRVPATGGPDNTGADGPGTVTHTTRRCPVGRTRPWVNPPREPRLVMPGGAFTELDPVVKPRVESSEPGAAGDRLPANLTPAVSLHFVAQRCAPFHFVAHRCAALRTVAPTLPVP